jgi:hypothetical protein
MFFNWGVLQLGLTLHQNNVSINQVILLQTPLTGFYPEDEFMARIPEQEIERLKNEVSVERLIESSGIALKKAGKDLLGCCPFHEDDTTISTTIRGQLRNKK